MPPSLRLNPLVCVKPHLFQVPFLTELALREKNAEPVSEGTLDASNSRGRYNKALVLANIATSFALLGQSEQADWLSQESPWLYSRRVSKLDGRD
jgi:hypothetical protein